MSDKEVLESMVGRYQKPLTQQHQNMLFTKPIPQMNKSLDHYFSDEYVEVMTAHGRPPDRVDYIFTVRGERSSVTAQYYMWPVNDD